MAFFITSCVTLTVASRTTVPSVGNPTPDSCFGSLSCSEICDGHQLLGRLETTSSCFQACKGSLPGFSYPAFPVVAGLLGSCVRTQAPVPHRLSSLNSVAGASRLCCGPPVLMVLGCTSILSLTPRVPCVIPPVSERLRTPGISPENTW